MTYDISTFKAAFGYKSSVVGQLADTLETKARLNLENLELQRLHQAVQLQHQLLEKSAELERINSKPLELLSQIRAKKLTREVEALKIDPRLDGAAAQLKLLEDLHDAEVRHRDAPSPMLAQMLRKTVAKARALLNVGEDFSTLGGGEEPSVETGKPSLEHVLRGGGELDLDKRYEGSDGKHYTVSQAIAGGGHSAFKLVNEQGEEFLWKPAESEMMLSVEVGASKMSALLMPGLVPPCSKLTIDGKDGTCQPFVKGADDKIKVEELEPKQKQQMVAHMLTDWLISNHDNHLKQFLFDEEKNLIGIDKGQAFKFFKQGDVESSFVTKAKAKALMNKDNVGLREQCLRDVEPEDLDPDYFPHSNIGMPASRGFMQSLHSSMEGVDTESGVIAETIRQARSMTIERLREMLGDYAAKAFGDKAEDFLKAVLGRAKGLDKQLARLQLSAPALARHHLEKVDELLVGGETFKPGSAPQIREELKSLRTALQSLKDVKGIDTAEAPAQGDEPSALYQLKLQLQALQAKQEKLAAIGKDCNDCEKYLSSEYRRVSPLLAAFEALKISPEVHADPKYDYSQHKDALLEHWRRIAVARGYADEGAAESWDQQAMSDTYETVRSMAKVWDAFPVPELPGDKVTRGDVAEHLIANYPALDPKKQALADGEHAVSISLTWPGVMSTTVGDPRQHSFIQKKSFVWSFDVKKPCPGRVIGDINPSEQEVTFAVGTKIRIHTLIVRRADKTLRSGEFGDQAELIALAELG